jgi:hypothetical protein
MTRTFLRVSSTCTSRCKPSPSEGCQRLRSVGSFLPRINDLLDGRKRHKPEGLVSVVHGMDTSILQNVPQKSHPLTRKAVDLTAGTSLVLTRCQPNRRISPFDSDSSGWCQNCPFICQSRRNDRTCKHDAQIAPLSFSLGRGR